MKKITLKEARLFFLLQTISLEKLKRKRGREMNS